MVPEANFNSQLETSENFWEALGKPPESFWELLGASGKHFRCFWKLLGGFQVLLESLWEASLEASGKVLGASGKPLGSFVGSF